MKIKPEKSAPLPQYPEKIAFNAKQAFVEAQPRRWRYIPLTAGALSVTLASATLMVMLYGCDKTRVAIDIPDAINVETPAPSPSTPPPSFLPSPTPTEPEERILRAAFVSQALSNPSQKFSWDEFQRLAPDYGFEMHVFAGESESAVEVAGIEQAIAEGYDAIFINPSSIEAIIPALRQAKDAGLIVGMFSLELPQEYQYLRDFFCGSDDYFGGILAGQFVSDQFPDGANFVEVGGQDGHPVQVMRSEGFRAGIASNIIELDARNCPNSWSGIEALAIMEDFIVKYGKKIDIVWCHWDNGASAVIEAVQAAGYKPGSGPGEIFIIGVDGNSTGYQQVKDGIQALSIGKDWTNMARKSLENARIMLEGGTVDAHNDIPMDMVTLEALDMYSVTPGLW